MGTTKVLIFLERAIGCYPVSETQSIPSRSEIIVYGDVNFTDKKWRKLSQNLSDSGLIAKTLVSVVREFLNECLCKSCSFWHYCGLNERS